MTKPKRSGKRKPGPSSPKLDDTGPFGSFWENLSADALGRRQGVQPVKNLDDLVGDWPEGESVDEFLALIRSVRGGDRS